MSNQLIIQNVGNLTSDFTVVMNATLRDARLSNGALGTWLRIISCKEDWKISIDGHVALYPKDKRDSVRSDLKELCKYRYLEVCEGRKIKGRFACVSMKMYHRPFDEQELSDEQVDFLFGKRFITGNAKEEEIKKMFPKGIFRYGFSDTENPDETRTKETRTKKTTTQEPKSEAKASVVVLSDLEEFNKLPLTEAQKLGLIKRHPLSKDEFEEAALAYRQYEKSTKVDSPMATITSLLKNKAKPNPEKEDVHERNERIIKERMGQCLNIQKTFNIPSRVFSVTDTHVCCTHPISGSRDVIGYLDNGFYNRVQNFLMKCDIDISKYKR